MEEEEELRRKVKCKEFKAEEEKKEGKDKKGLLTGSQEVLPCFDFYNNLESFDISDL
jgi:hypothetical protein